MKVEEPICLVDEKLEPVFLFVSKYFRNAYLLKPTPLHWLVNSLLFFTNSSRLLAS